MIRAEADTSFFRRFLWIAMACALGIAWCLFDALVTYPKKLQIALLYESYPQTEEGLQAWDSDASSRGWLTDAPEKTAHEIEALILNQYILMGGCIILGLLMLWKWYRPRGSWIECHENLIRDSYGRSVSLDSIVGIDRRRWEQKGIAVLHFLKDGKPSKFILDDFKYKREPMGEIMECAENQLQALIEESERELASQQGDPSEDAK